ncbi:uncharacterized protein LOC111085704 [Limulus polyphemus]|uniref:Uncharacterized protein LOC111085704 n=1 Tax=Limulus polyphemus TaxID=6850 RepID=A0ABM1SCB0_LIMPO|nr:uncharacterized protein LOC111085704 [Limulus polyphemus]
MALFIWNLVKKLYRIGHHQTSSDNGQTNEPEAQATVSYSVTGESVLIPNNGATRNTFTSSSSREARDNSQSLLSCEHLTDILWIDCDNSSDLDAVKGKTNNERLAEIVGPPERESVRIEFSETELRPTCNKPIKETVNDSTQRNADGGKSKLNNHTVRPSFVNKDDNSFGSQPIGVVRHQTLTSEETEMNRDEISPERLSDYCTIDKIDKSLQNVAVELSYSRKPLCEKLTDTNPTFEKHDVTYLKNSTENSHKLDILVPDEGHCKIPDNCQKSKSEESFRDELRFPKEQVTLGQVRVEDGVQKSIQDGSHQTNIGIHNTETSGALRNCEATKGRIKRRELLRSSGGNILRPARRPSDVAALTESTFSAIYQPFNSVKTQLVRQARDILLCQFLGDFKKFHEGFLLPAGTLLQIIQYKLPPPPELWIRGYDITVTVKLHKMAVFIKYLPSSISIEN